MSALSIVLHRSVSSLSRSPLYLLNASDAAVAIHPSQTSQTLLPPRREASLFLSDRHQKLWSQLKSIQTPYQMGRQECDFGRRYFRILGRSSWIRGSDTESHGISENLGHNVKT